MKRNERIADGSTTSDAGAPHEIASRGVAGGGGPLPHAEAIQRSFGRHDVSHVRAHVGGEAAVAARAIGARAYAMGSDVAFASAPDLHTAAHEAAHTVQQRGGVQLAGGVGREGDAYERNADAVADRVVAGASAEDLLDGFSGPATAALQKAAGDKTDSDATADAAGDGDAGNAAWARGERAKVRDARAAIHRQQQLLFADAMITSSSLQAARAVFRVYDDREKSARAHFEQRIGDELAKAAHKRAVRDMLINTVLGMVPYTRLITGIALATGAVKSISGALAVARTVNAGIELKGQLDTATGVAEKVDLVASFADVKATTAVGAAPKGEIDWEVLVDGALAAFEDYLAATHKLDALDAACDDVIDQLTEVSEGSSSAGPGSALAVSATKLAGIDDLATRKAGPAALDFMHAVVTKLGPLTQREIERKLAIRWLAALPEADLGAVDDCKDYLDSLGVIGERSQRGLDVDPQESVTDHEAKIIKWRAQTKVFGDKAIGRRASWLGGRRIGDEVVGTIRYRGREYRASGPAEPQDRKCHELGTYLPTERGGSVVIDGADLDEGLVTTTSNWEETPRNDDALHGALYFSVLPTEDTRPGANGFDSDGPELSAG
ncbi:MAG: DUF4157 domain-containing protein [Deltaproteobacteria bacterium]|nr:DUF4157 domain-containing protein [Kofleriaceae bacterium]